MTETTDEKLIGNFRKLIDRCAGHTDYQPSNLLLGVAKLETQYAAAFASVKDVDVRLAPHRVDINERRIGYDRVGKLFRRSRSNLRSSGASPEFIEDASGIVNKIVGTRQKAVASDKPETSETEAAKSHSAAQLSYESVLGNIRAYTELVKNEAHYKPNEEDLKIASLEALADDLEAKNNAVSLSYVPVSQSRGLRDRLLYNDRNNLIDTALAVKNYVAGLGTDHQLYKSIKGLKFARQKK